ncbi:MAG TPA: response regulator transcription factor [Acidobacteriaceae bacterium]
MPAPPGSTAGGLGMFLPGSGQGRQREAAAPPSLASAPRILVVEDDEPLARLLASGLAAESFLVHLAHDGEAAERALAAGPYDLLILDLNLPRLDGLTLLQRVRATGQLVPVLVLTGRTRTEDMVKSLDQGADDCLLKPFSLLEFMARVRVLLRRSMPAPQETGKATGLVLDRSEFRAERNGRQINLTPREFAVLEFLVLHAGKPLSRATLMEEVWKMPFEANTNIVDVYMKYLRDKIDGSGEEKLIHTVRGVGYVLRTGAAG